MRTSETMNRLAAAYLAAQQEMGHPARKSENPHLRNKFADLPTVIDEVKPVLNKHGLAIIQSVGGFNGNVVVTTRLMHPASGEWLEDTIERIPQEQKGLTPDQVIGCIITYMRRYQLSTIAGVASEPDNDGNEGKVAPEEKPKRTMKAAARRADPEPAEAPKLDLNEWRRTFFATIRGDALGGMFNNDEQRKAWCKTFSGKESTKDWTAQDFIAAISRLEDIKASMEFDENLGRHE